MKSSVALPVHARSRTPVAQTIARLLDRLGALCMSGSLPWITISLGAVLRISEYLSNRSLWLDESRVALNVIDRSFLELLQPLDYNQGAPVGFLMVEKLAVLALGEGEYALRLLPLLAGIAALPLFYALARRCLTPTAALVALGLFAFADRLLYYSSEVKQYSGDVALALVLYLATLHVARAPHSLWRLVAYGLLGGAAIWFSHPAVFVLGGAGISLTLYNVIKRDWATSIRLCVVFSLWAGSLAVNYVVSLGSLSSHDYMLRYWSDLFVPFPPRTFADTQWFARTFLAVFSDPVGQTLPGVAALAFVVGCFSYLSRDRKRFLILIAPLFLALLAAGLRKYPFGDRLLLFAVPVLLILIAEGTERIREKTFSTSPMIWMALLVFLFYHPLASAGYHLAKPRTVEEIKPVISYVEERRQEGDVLYLYYMAERPFEYYARILEMTGAPYIVGVGSDVMNRLGDDLDRLRGQKRVWLIFSHVNNSYGVNQERFYIYYLDNIGKKLDFVSVPGATAYLYDLRAKH